MGAVLASIVGLAFTANGYRPLGKGGYGSAFSFAYGVVASELPMQSLGVQFTTLAALSRRLPARTLKFTWLLSAVSWLGLLGLRRFGHQANEPLTAAL
ncbi:esterase, partial [Mycobacterium simiae]